MKKNNTVTYNNTQIITVDLKNVYMLVIISFIVEVKYNLDMKWVGGGVGGVYGIKLFFYLILGLHMIWTVFTVHPTILIANGIS